jgi:hypothetical protein
MLDAALPVLCADLGLDTPLPDARGSYYLALPDGLNLTLAETREGLRLSGIIRELTPENSPGNLVEAGTAEALCRELLILSLGRARGECAASFPRLALKGGTLVLEDDIAPELDIQDSLHSVERFLNLLEKWTGLAAEKERWRSSQTQATRGIITP